MIDDVATTGGSVVNAIKSLKEAKIRVEDAFVIVNRMEGADEALQEQGVRLHSILDVLQITKVLNENDIVDDSVLKRVEEQMARK